MSTHAEHEPMERPVPLWRHVLNIAAIAAVLWAFYLGFSNEPPSQAGPADVAVFSLSK